MLSEDFNIHERETILTYCHDLKKLGMIKMVLLIGHDAIIQITSKGEKYLESLS